MTKKIGLLVLFVFMYVLGKSQAISQRGTSAVTVQDARLFTQYNFRPPVFPDTTSANAQIGLDSCGALIFSRDINAYYYRACSPKRWVAISSGGGSVDTTSLSNRINNKWDLFGNSNAVAGTNFLGTTNNIPLEFRIKNVKSGIIDSTNKNVGLGFNTLKLNTPNGGSVGTFNVAVGHNALSKDTFGFQNVAVGGAAMGTLTTNAQRNVAIGYAAMNQTRTPTYDVALGWGALPRDYYGSGNVAIGADVANFLPPGVGDTMRFNTMVGYASGYQKYSGRNNVFIGDSTGALNQTGSRNVFIGSRAGKNETGSDKLYIANSGTTSPLIKGDFANQTVIMDGKLLVGGSQIPDSTLDVKGGVRLQALLPSNNASDSMLVVKSNGGVGYRSVPANPPASGYYLSISDSTTQDNPTANIPRAVKFNVTDLANGFSLNTQNAVFVGVINNGGVGAGTTLNVTSLTSGKIKVGMVLTGGGITTGTFISAFISGSGGIGTYEVSISQLKTSATYTGTMTSQIVCANTGIYNLQFSSQMDKTDAGVDYVNFWLRKNGTDIAASSGVISLQGNSPAYMMAAWNYVIQLIAGDTIELYWGSADINMSIKAETSQTSPFAHPAVQSTIFTITQQAGILAGTGITAINSLTGAAQTMVTGTDSTDFKIVSTGTTHKFNLPTASATNRGALSSANWSTFNSKLGASDTVSLSNRINLKLNISDTANKWVNNISRTIGKDSIIFNIGSTRYAIKDSVGSGTAYTFSTGLTNSSGTVTSNLSTGVSGGQSVVGGTAASNSLTLSSTSNATKGKLLFGTSAYDEVNNRFGIGTASPSYAFDVVGTGTGNGQSLVRFTNPTNFNLNLALNSTGTTGNTNFGFTVNDVTQGAVGWDRTDNSIQFWNAIANASYVGMKLRSDGNTSFFKVSDGSENVRFVSSTGNVLIGTTTDAGYKLDVNGTARAVTSLQTPTLLGNTTSGGTLTLQSTSNATKGKILFGTSAYDEVNNRLGIGVDNPQSKLWISDNTSVNANLYNSGTQFNISGTPLGQMRIISAENTSDFGGYSVFTGIRSRGTLSSPTPPLSGDAITALLSNAYDGTASGGGTAGVYFLADANVSAGNAPQRIQFSTSTSNNLNRIGRLTIKPNGNVIITASDNPTDAGYKLDVNGTARANQFQLSALNTAPATATSTGTTGEIRIVNGAIYVCVATNTWQRALLTTF